MYRQIQRIAKDEVNQRQPHRIPCKILKFFPDGQYGPTAFVIPYARIGSSDQEPALSQADFENQYVHEVYVRFPRGILFHVDPEKYDMWVDSDFEWAREGFPVLKGILRGQAAQVSAGWTRQEIAEYDKTNLMPFGEKDIKRRAFNARNQLGSRSCNLREPRFPTNNDIWMGPLRQKVDSLVAEIWDKPKRMSARFNRSFSTLLTEKVDFPLTDGVRIQWRDRVEHPFQKNIGSTAVTPYQRFIFSLVDPSQIVGVAKAVIDFLKTQDSRVSTRFTSVDEYEFIDNNQFLPEA
jgi:hypothetical protein